jgi:protein-S-isoprenylcysteine O-methyltransferase Ste14
MKLLSTWGLNAESWKGGRGEYWVVAQAGLMLGFLLLPIYHPIELPANLAPDLASYGRWMAAALLLLGAIILVIKGLLDLGQSLTPLPYPKADGQLIQTGSYGLVRHPLYSGVILAALAYAVGQSSLSHLVGTLVLLLFFDRKASREETWLSEKYPDYGGYQQRVKKLIPWLY